MDDKQAAKLARVQFVRGSLSGLITLAKTEQFEMLSYLLEMALAESVDLEQRLKGPTGKNSPSK